MLMLVFMLEQATPERRDRKGNHHMFPFFVMLDLIPHPDGRSSEKSNVSRCPPSRFQIKSGMTAPN